ncbi:MAG: murein L,D-transpeptidase [Granulosicoccus sp.]
MNRVVIAVSLISILTGTEVLANETGIKGVSAEVNYERSGPTAKAALFADAPVPKLGAAHAISLATELSRDLSGHELAALEKYGPWLTAEGISNNAQQLIRAIQNSRIHGFNPKAYGETQIMRTMDTLTHIDTQRTISNNPLAHFDPRIVHLRDKLNRLLDVGFAKLVTHHGQGLVDARAIQKGLYRDVPVVPLDTYKQALSTGVKSVREIIRSAQPASTEYHRLTQRMRDLLTEYASGIDRVSIEPTGNLWATHRHDEVFTIKRRLIETGDLPLSTVLTPFFDADLVVALEQFQKRNGLISSGIVDLKTREALNFSIRDEITAVSLSLERWRWMPRDLGDKHLFVNIPDYRVLVKEGEESTLSMVAVVGAVEHPTPTFSKDLSYMEFNPTWTVPAKIANRELLPKERRKPGYLASRNFDYLKRVGNKLVKVPSTEVTQQDFQQNPFPYVLQQRGGPGNALGRMKFMMPNPYAIYLHDTQAKRHFTLNDRAFSHGCIRLSEPDRLAQLLLKSDGYSAANIEQALTKKNTHRVRFRTPIPTHLTYITSWVDDTGAWQTRPDIYGHNPPLTSALRASNSLLSLIYKNSFGDILNTIVSAENDS